MILDELRRFRAFMSQALNNSTHPADRIAAIHLYGQYCRAEEEIQNYTNQTKKHTTKKNQIYKHHAVLLLERMMYLKALSYFLVKQRHVLLWDI